MSRILLRDLTPGTNYVIQLRTDAGDIVSDWSRQFPVTTTSDTTPPTIPAWIAPEASAWVVDGDTFVAQWQALDFNLDQNKDFSHYELVLSDGVKSVTVKTNNLVFVLTFEQNKIFFGTPRATVTAKVRSVDQIGNASNYSTQLSATNPAPAAVNNLIVNPLYDAIDVKWDANTEADLSNYVVQLSTTGVGGTYTTIYSGLNNQFTHRSTQWSTDHFFRVLAVDKFGTTSTAVTSGAVKPKSSYIPDALAPKVPTFTTLATITNNANGVGSRASLSWTAVTQNSDNSPITDLAGYYVRYRRVGDTNWTTVQFTSDVTAGIIELQLAYTNYEFQIKAFDWSNNESAWSSTFSATSPSNTAPANVTGLTSTGSTNNITLNWNAVADTDIRNYEVTVSKSATFATGNTTYLTGTATTLTVGGLDSGTNYYMRVRAVDHGGLTSPAWTETSRATNYYDDALSDGTAPPTPSAPTIQPGFGSLFVSWSAVSNNDPVTYEVHISDVSGFTPSAGTKTTETGSLSIVVSKMAGGAPLLKDKTYYIKLIARDADGSSSASSQASGKVDAGILQGAEQILNGSGEYGTNEFWTAATRQVSDAPLGKPSSYNRAGTTQSVVSTQRVIIDTTKKYLFKTSVKQKGTGTGNFYNGFNPLDADGLEIRPYHYCVIAGTLTTLAADLVAGQTTMQLTSSANWDNSATTSRHYAAFWNYTDGQGKTWANETYTRNVTSTAMAWAAGGISGNTVTLGAAWTGATVPAGTPVSNTISGGTYIYSQANVAATTSWVEHSMMTPTGFAPAGQIASFTTGWPMGMVYVNPIMLLNYNVSGTSDIWFSGVSLSEASAAQATADGKNTVSYRTNSNPAVPLAQPSLTGRREGDIDWVRSTAAGSTGQVVQQSRVVGGVWVDEKINGLTVANITAASMVAGTITAASGIIADAAITNAKIDTVSASKLTAGSVAAQIITIASTGSIQSTDYAAGSVGWKLSTGGLEINNGAVKASVLTAGTLTSTTGVIQVGSGASIVMNGGYLKSNTYTGTTQATNPSGAGFYLGNDGIRVDQGMINAAALTTGTINTAVITLGGTQTAGVIQTASYNGTSGFRLSSQGLEIPDGTLSAAKLNINAGVNLMPSKWSSFEEVTTNYIIPTISDNASNAGTNSVVTAASESITAQHGSQVAKMVHDATTTPLDLHLNYLGEASSTTTEFQTYGNIPLAPGAKYIISYYALIKSGAPSAAVSLVKRSTSGSSVVSTSSAIPATGVWTRVTTSYTAATNDQWMTLALRTSTANSVVYIDAVQVEQVAVGVSAASTYVSPDSTSIYGGQIRTAELRSTSSLTVNGVTMPTWSINSAGNVVFGNTLIRGNAIVGYSNEDGTVTDGSGSSIKSYNYAEGLAGWQIRSDGYAEFRDVVIDGNGVEPGTLSAEAIRSGSILTSEVIVQGSLHTKGVMGEDIGMDAAGFHVLGPYQVAITNVSRSGNTVTATTASNHGFTVGNDVLVSKVFFDESFNGRFVIGSVTSNTFTYTTETSGTVSSTQVMALAKSMSSDAFLTRPVLIDFPTDGQNPNIVSGTLSSDTLTVEVGSTLRGTHTLENNAVFNINQGVESPKVSPTVANTWPSKNIAYDVNSYGTIYGMTIGHNGNYFIVSKTSSTNWITEYDYSTGAFIATRLSDSTSGTGPAGSSTTNNYYGLTYNPVNNVYYTVRRFVSTAFGDGDTFETIDVYDTSWVHQADYDVKTHSTSSSGWGLDALGWDFVANKPLFLQNTSATGWTLIPVNIDASGIPVSNAATVNLNNTSTCDYPRFITRLNNLGGISADRYYAKDSKYLSDSYTRSFLPYTYAASGSLSVQTSEWWRAAGYGHMAAAVYDPTTGKIHSLDSTGTKLHEYQNNDAYWSDTGTAWTKTSWVGYSWAEDAGTTYTVTNKARTGTLVTLTLSTSHSILVGEGVNVTGVDAALNGYYTVTAVTSNTVQYNTVASGTIASSSSSGNVAGPYHETSLSPIRNIAHEKRAKLSVNISSIPNDPTNPESPTKANIYLSVGTTQPSLSAPVSTAWKLRETVLAPETSTVIVPVTSPSGRQPLANGENQFIAIATPAMIQALSGSSYWKGSGEAKFSDVRYVGDSWNDLTLSNLWVNYGSPYQTAQYRVENRRVILRGLIRSGTIGATMFTLPEGARPPADIIVSGVVNQYVDGGVTLNDIPVRINITASTGAVALSNASSTPSNGYLSLSEISFYID